MQYLTFLFPSLLLTQKGTGLEHFRVVKTFFLLPQALLEAHRRLPLDGTGCSFHIGLLQDCRKWRFTTH